MSTADNSVSITCSGCGRRLNVPAKAVDNPAPFECRKCNARMVLKMDDGGVRVVKHIEARKRESAKDIPPESPNDEPTSVQTSTLAKTDAAVLAHASQSVIDEKQLHEIAGKLFERLKPEITATVAKSMKENVSVSDRLQRTESISRATTSINDQVSQLIADVSRNLQGEIQKLRTTLVEEYASTKQAVTASMDEELKNMDFTSDLKKKIDSDLKKKFDQFLTEVGKKVLTTTRESASRLTEAVRKAEGEPLAAYRFPKSKRKKEGAGVEIPEAQLLELGNLMANAAISPESIARLMEDLRTLDVREVLLKDLPVLFDFVELEIISCERNSDSDQAALVMPVLQRLSKRMKAWMDRNQIVVFPNVDDPHDWKTQECIGTRVAEPGDMGADGCVADVKQKGYKFSDSEVPLRYARVICYANPVEP